MITPERGKLYLVKHSSGIIKARFLNVREIAGRAGLSYKWKAKTHYIFQSMRTERDIELKSRVKILREIEG